MCSDSSADVKEDPTKKGEGDAAAKPDAAEKEPAASAPPDEKMEH